MRRHASRESVPPRLAPAARRAGRNRGAILAAGMNEAAPPRREALAETLRKYLQRGAQANVSRLLGRIRPEDVAVLLGGLDDDERLAVFRVLLAEFPDAAGEVLTEMQPAVRLGAARAPSPRADRRDPRPHSGRRRRLRRRLAAAGARRPPARARRPARPRRRPHPARLPGLERGPPHGHRVLRASRVGHGARGDRGDPGQGRRRDDLLPLRRRPRRPSGRRHLAAPAAALEARADASTRSCSARSSSAHVDTDQEEVAQPGGALRPAGRAGGRRPEPAGRHRHRRRHHRRRQGRGGRGPDEDGRHLGGRAPLRGARGLESPGSACRRCSSASPACWSPATCSSASRSASRTPCSCSPSCR